MDYAGITSLLTFVGLLAGFQIACAIVSVAGSSISLSHSLKEAPKRTDFIVFSSLGLAFGIIGFFNLIFGILGVISTVVSMAKDSWDRKLRGYVLTMVLVTAIIGGGYSYFMNTLTSDVMSEIDGLSDVGVDTINQLNTTNTYPSNTSRSEINREGVAVQHSGGTYTTYNANSGVSVNVYLEINDDGTITAKDMYSNTYNITKVVNEDGDVIQVGNTEDGTSTDDQTDSGYYRLSDEKNN